MAKQETISILVVIRFKLQVRVSVTVRVRWVTQDTLVTFSPVYVRCQTTPHDTYYVLLYNP